MKINLLTLTVMSFFVTNSFAAPASIYNWLNTGSSIICAEVTPNGGYIRNVPGDRCRDSVGSTISWTEVLMNGAVICAEFTPSGEYISNVTGNACRFFEGSKYEWNESIRGHVICAEFTPDGSYIMNVSGDFCRNSDGEVHKRRLPF